MRFLSALLALPLVSIPLASAHPVNDDAVNFLQGRASGNVITTGATGNVYPRLEIRQMLNTKPNQWTLFLLAMQQWQTTSQSSPTSYFGIAKIHGVPEENYNNIGKCSSCNSAWGYCCHANVLFPAWHRTYMALFEQEFLAIVDNVVGQFTGSRQATMKAAAADMRFPYWDWAAHPPSGLPTIPKVITMETISVNGPKGAQTIKNPLFQSNINDPSSMYYADFITYTTTKRYPTTNSANAVSQNNMVTSVFNQVRSSLQQSVYSLMTACTDYGSFSNTNGGSNGGCSTSLEYIHNLVHDYTGGGPNSQANTVGGNMYNLPLASFDPVFWLHHAMVDRLFAMWQTLHPNSYGASQTVQSGAGTWTVAEGSVQNANSNLTPFYKDNNGNFWTTNQVKNWANTFKYTYPEFVDSDGSASAIASYVNKLYGPSATATAGSTKRTAMPEPVAEAAAQITSSAEVEDEAEVEARDTASTYQWSANVKAPHGALQGSYAIYVFTGTPSSDNPSMWIMDANFAGLVPMLMSGKPGTTTFSNDTSLLTGAVPLTGALNSLIAAGKLSSLDPSVVTPFLTSNLQWRVSGPTGASVNAKLVPGLLVAASSTTLSPISSVGELPTVGNFQILPEITQNRAGGLNHTANWAATTVGELSASLQNVTESLTAGLTNLVGSIL